MMIKVFVFSAVFGTVQCLVSHMCVVGVKVPTDGGQRPINVAVGDYYSPSRR